MNIDSTYKMEQAVLSWEKRQVWSTNSSCPKWELVTSIHHSDSGHAGSAGVVNNCSNGFKVLLWVQQRQHCRGGDGGGLVGEGDNIAGGLVGEGDNIAGGRISGGGGGLVGEGNNIAGGRVGGEHCRRVLVGEGDNILYAEIWWGRGGGQHCTGIGGNNIAGNIADIGDKISGGLFAHCRGKNNIEGGNTGG